MSSSRVEGGQLGLEVVEELVAAGHLLVEPRDVLGGVFHEEHLRPAGLLLLLMIEDLEQS